MAVGAGMVATALVALALGENASGEVVTSIRFSQKKTGETAVLPRRTVYSVIIQGRESAAVPAGAPLTAGQFAAWGAFLGDVDNQRRSSAHERAAVACSA